MNDRTEFLHPDYEPGEFDQVERQLRQALARDAEQVRPSKRLDTILHEAHEVGPVTATGGSGTRRWLMPLAAAAAVAAIIGGVWWSGQDDRPTVTPPQTNGPTQSLAVGPDVDRLADRLPDHERAGRDDSRCPCRSTSSARSVATRTSTSCSASSSVRTCPPAPPRPTKAKAALVLAINAQPYSNTDGYLQPWSGQTIGDVRNPSFSATRTEPTFSGRISQITLIDVGVRERPVA